MNGPTALFKKRMVLSRLLGVCAAIAYLFMASVWPGRNPWLAAALALTGMLLVALGVMGRVWALSYLAGRKDKKLVTEGPFSLCRNPLYLFSFLGVLGLCLRTRTLLIPAAVMPVFLLIHRRSVRKEEGRLREKFGEEYEAYAGQVPRFVPAVARFRESDSLTVNAVLFGRGVMELSVFFLVLCFFELVTTLQQTGVAPVWLRIY